MDTEELEMTAEPDGVGETSPSKDKAENGLSGGAPEGYAAAIAEYHELLMNGDTEGATDALNELLLAVKSDAMQEMQAEKMARKDSEEKEHQERTQVQADFVKNIFSKVITEDESKNDEMWKFANDKVVEYLKQGMSYADAVDKAGQDLLAQYQPDQTETEGGEDIPEVETETETEDMSMTNAAPPPEKMKKEKPESPVPTAASAPQPALGADYPTTPEEVAEFERSQRMRTR